jgi:hypothetical protein
MEGFFWTIIGLIICSISWKAGLGSFQEPGSGFIGFICGGLILVLGVILILSRFSSKILPDTRPLSRQVFREAPVLMLLVTVMSLVVYGFFLEILGYNIATFLVMWVLFYLFYERGRRQLIMSGLASLMTTGITYVVFEIWLRSQLPHGFFPWW